MAATVEEPVEVTKYTVYRYTAKAGGYEGVIFFTVMKTEKTEIEQLDEELEVIANDVTLEEAQQHSRSTPLHARILSALQEATLPNSKVCVPILQGELQKNLFATRLHKPNQIHYPISFANKSPAAVILLAAFYASVFEKSFVDFEALEVCLQDAIRVISESDLAEKE